MKSVFLLSLLISFNTFAANNCSIYFENLNRLKIEMKQPQVSSFAETYVDKINLVEKMLSLKGYSFVESATDAKYDLTFVTRESKDLEDYPVTYAGITLKQLDNGQEFNFGKRSETKLFHGPMNEYPLLFSVAFSVKRCQK